MPPRKTQKQVQAIQAKQRDAQRGRSNMRLKVRQTYPSGAIYIRYEEFFPSPFSERQIYLHFVDAQHYNARIGGFNPPLPQMAPFSIELMGYTRHNGMIGRWLLRKGYFEKFGMTHFPPHMPQWPEFEEWVHNQYVPYNPDTAGARPDSQGERFARTPIQVWFNAIEQAKDGKFDRPPPRIMTILFSSGYLPSDHLFDWDRMMLEAQSFGLWPYGMYNRSYGK